MLKLAIGVSSSGAQLEFTNSDIISYEGDSELSLTGDELSIDTVTVTVRYEYEYGGDIITADNYLIETSDSYILAAANSTGKDILSFVRNTYCKLYRDENIAEEWWLDSVKRIGIYVYEIQLMSFPGVLDQTESYTSVYSGTALSSVAQTLGYYGAVETETGKIKVYGWLKQDNARVNFARFMQAYNLNLIRTATGSYLLTSMFADEAQDVPDSRIFMSGSVEKNAPLKTVEVEEYTFSVASVNEGEVEIFSGTVPLNTYVTKIIDDDVPYFDYSTLNYNAERALVNQFKAISGVSQAYFSYYITANVLVMRFEVYYTAGTVLPAANITLKAIPYTINKNTATYSQYSGTTQVARITGNGFISARNSQPVAQRLLHESLAEKVTADLIIDDERAGRFIGFNDTFRDNRTGFITKMHTTMSSFLKARCTIISGFVPVPQISTYTAFVVLTDSGTWTIPSGVFTKATPLIRVTLIGGGQAGYDGENGADGSNYSYGSAAQGGAGGKGGKGGAGGAALTQEINCTGLTSFTYSCGSGGASNGALGSATTFGSYSSANGTTPSSGYINEFNGAVYCLSGADGTDGAAGGKGGVCTASTNTPPTAGEDYTDASGNTYSGGAAGTNKVQTWYVPEGYIGLIAQYTSGYGGGGAACGSWANGYNGGAGSGGGASNYGCGGGGGHGGGGGGGGGGEHGVYNDGEYFDYGGAGVGGAGGVGARGGAGIVVIYY